jgi:hypothetical protein
MFPWKLLFRFFSAMVLFATGGFAAGHDLPLPFVSPPEVAAPAPADSTTTTTAPPAVVDTTTTTTTAPPVVVDPVPVPAPVDTPPVTPAPTTPPKPVTTTTTAPPAVIPAPVVTPPAVPVDAPSVCAAAGATVCGPAAPAPAADDTHAARVQRCKDWWNSLADALAANNRPEWATRARDIAGRCEEMITGWEQAQQPSQDHQNTGDHNNDGHPDNGWNHGHDDGDNQAPPPAQPQAQQVSRHGEGRH